MTDLKRHDLLTGQMGTTESEWLNPQSPPTNSSILQEHHETTGF